MQDDVEKDFGERESTMSSKQQSPGLLRDLLEAALLRGDDALGAVQLALEDLVLEQRLVMRRAPGYEWGQHWGVAHREPPKFRYPPRGPRIG